MARKAASDAAPQGPAWTPCPASSRAAVAASSSVTATQASRPGRMKGQASEDTVPQFSPAMLVTPVSTVTGWPAATLARTQAADRGSTLTMAGPAAAGPDGAGRLR
jgi:hypothetical protein